jgi:hypothetical protein
MGGFFLGGDLWIFGVWWDLRGQALIIDIYPKTDFEEDRLMREG